MVEQGKRVEDGGAQDLGLTTSGCPSDLVSTFTILSPMFAILFMRLFITAPVPTWRVASICSASSASGRARNDNDDIIVGNQ